MSEELLNKIFDKLVSMEQDIQAIKATLPTLATKEDINCLAAETQKDVIAMLDHISKKTDSIENKLDVLNDRTFENEADIRYLKKAR